jgi:hypothetical protein
MPRGSGFVRFAKSELVAALAEADIRGPADAAERAKIRLLAAPGAQSDPSECQRIRKLTAKWFAHPGETLQLQVATVEDLRKLIGADRAEVLLGGARAARTDTREHEDAAPLIELRHISEGMSAEPHLLYEEDGRRHRDRLIEVMGQLCRPTRHRNLSEVARTLRFVTTRGLEVARLLEPFVRCLNATARHEPGDIDLLCAFARFANNLSHLVNSQRLSASDLAEYARCRRVFLVVFGLLDEAAADPSLPDVARSAACWELMLHSVSSVRISGDSIFNLSRLSASRPLPDELRFSERMRTTIYYASLLRQLPQLPHVSRQHQLEVAHAYRSALLRGMMYARDPRRRPTREKVEAASQGMESPEKLAARNSTLLRYFAVNGDLASARRTCDELRSNLASSPESSLPDLLEPIYAINAHRLGGGGTAAEYRDAVARLRDEPQIMFLYGHHMLSAGGDDPLAGSP